MKKKITVDLTYSWTFDKKEWSDEKKHLDGLKDSPQIVLGYDLLNAFHSLNDITYPELKEIKVTEC